MEKDEKLLLLPIHGSDTGWYQNLVKTPQIRLAAGYAELEATAKPVDNPDAVADTVELFGEKYGADRVRDYYPTKDAFAEVPLS